MLRILYRLVNYLFGALCRGVSFILHEALQNRKSERILKFKKEKRSRQHLFKTTVLWKHGVGTGGGVVAPSDRKKRLISKDLPLGEQTSYTIFSLSRLSGWHSSFQPRDCSCCVQSECHASFILRAELNRRGTAKLVHLFVFVFEPLESFSGSSENVEGWVQNTIIFLPGN